MCKYEMDPMSIVEDTEWKWFCPQTDRWIDGQGETSIPPVFGAGFENNLSVGQVAQKIHLSWYCPKLSQILKKSQHLDNYRLAG